MSKSGGVPKNDLNPGSPGKLGSNKLFSRKTGSEPAGGVPYSPGCTESLCVAFGAHLWQLRSYGMRCIQCGEMKASPAAFKAPASDDATGSMDGSFESPSSEHKSECGCADATLLRESLNRVLAQRDELERRLTLVNQAPPVPRLSDVNERMLLDALGAKARALGERATICKHTEGEAAAEAWEHAKGKMAALLMVSRKLVPDMAYWITREYEIACIETGECLGNQELPLPPEPTEDEIPW